LDGGSRVERVHTAAPKELKRGRFEGELRKGGRHQPFDPLTAERGTRERRRVRLVRKKEKKTWKRARRGRRMPQERRSETENLFGKKRQRVKKKRGLGQHAERRGKEPVRKKAWR